MVANIPWISSIVFLIPMSEEVKKKASQFRELGSKQYDERRIQGTEPNDIFSYLIDSYTKERSDMLASPVDIES